MVKKRPDEPSPGSVTPHLRQSSNVRVSLAAMADGMGEMMWIAAGHGPGTSLVSNPISDSGEPGDCPEDAVREDCERGGFGWTGGQFYKPDGGP